MACLNAAICGSMMRTVYLQVTTLMKITLAENFRAVFYAPFYAAYARGEFEQRGVDIAFVESPTPGSAISLMHEGKVDVVWGGPLRAIKLRDEHAPEDRALLAFCEVVGKDPFFLVAREQAVDGFSFEWLMQARLAVVNEVPTPWLCLQEDIRDAGLDPRQIKLVADQSMAENLDALVGGSVDVAQFFEPYVSMAESSGAGQVVYSSASRGMTAYTTFLSTAPLIEKNREAFERMASAIESIRDWINLAEPSEIADTIAAFYPHVSHEILRMSMARYQRTGLWTCQRTVSETGFNRLRQSMKNSGFITSVPSYERCVASI